MDSENEMSSLRHFFDVGLVTDVLHVIKSGKEATVYCCKAGRSVAPELLAAKVYRPRAFRSFKNDAIYQQPRVITDARLARAYRNKTRTGRNVQFATWVSHEYETLKLLHAAGSDVPKPFAQSRQAVLMEYVGDSHSAAPLLKGASLSSHEARHLFDVVTANVELWLANNRVHADLSPFNVLYWNGEVKVIDFPQAVDPRINQSAFALLLRDVENVCRYFSRYGINGNPRKLAADLWTRFLQAEL
jgi:RIO kinase 1